MHDLLEFLMDVSRQLESLLNNSTQSYHIDSSTIYRTKYQQQQQAKRVYGTPIHLNFRYFVALFDYDPSTMSPNPNAASEELAFKRGSIIRVIDDKEADGFYRGELDNHIGYVPCNVVSEITDPNLLFSLTEKNRQVAAMSASNAYLSQQQSEIGQQSKAQLQLQQEIIFNQVNDQLLNPSDPGSQLQNPPIQFTGATSRQQQQLVIDCPTNPSIPPSQWSTADQQPIGGVLSSLLSSNNQTSHLPQAGAMGDGCCSSLGMINLTGTSCCMPTYSTLNDLPQQQQFQNRQPQQQIYNSFNTNFEGNPTHYPQQQQDYNHYFGYIKTTNHHLL